MKFLKVQSALPRSGSLLLLVCFLPLKSADVSRAVTRDKALRTSGDGRGGGLGGQDGAFNTQRACELIR